MKHIRLFEQFINESFLSNVKDAIKKGDAYHLFKGKTSHQNRKKITPDQAKELISKSKELGLEVELYKNSSWAYKKGTDQTEWIYNFSGDNYIYYGNEYEQYLAKI
jgi:hypothetical protein